MMVRGFLVGWLSGNAGMDQQTQKTCSIAGPLCIIPNPFFMSGQRLIITLPILLLQHTPERAFVQWRVIHTGGGRGNVAWQASDLDPTLDAELFLDIFDAVKRVLKFLPMHHLIAQGVHVCFDSADSRIKMIQARVNAVKPHSDSML